MIAHNAKKVKGYTMICLYRIFWKINVAMKQ